MATTPSATVPTAGSLAALAVPQRFLRWYAPRMDSLNRMCIIPAGCSPDTADQYAVDFKQVELYLGSLDRGHFLSPFYKARRRAYYHQWQDSLARHPVYDGPPRGFEFDLVTFSQDPDDLSELLKAQPRLLHLAADSARVSLANPLEERVLTFGLLRQQGRWLIRDIRPGFSAQ